MFSVGCEKDVITSEPDTSKDSLSDDEYEYEEEPYEDDQEAVPYEEAEQFLGGKIQNGFTADTGINIKITGGPHEKTCKG